MIIFGFSQQAGGGDMFHDGLFHVIPSVRDIRYLNQALIIKEEWLLLSNIHIGNLKSVTDFCHKSGKKVMVNHELVGGLGADRTACQMLKNYYHVDAVMGSSNRKLAMMSKEGLPTVRRIALIDSLAVDQVFNTLGDTHCNMIELRPAFYAIRTLERFQKEHPGCYVAAGFIDSEEMLENVRKAGFSGAMTSCVSLWR